MDIGIMQGIVGTHIADLINGHGFLFGNALGRG